MNEIQKNNPSQKQTEKNHQPIFSQKTADLIADIIGSWQFIVLQMVLLLLWIIINITAWSFHWDPYPFIFLNLLLSIQAAFAGPIILMSQNRAAERDRKKAEIDLATDRKAEREIEALQISLDKINRNKIDKILEILKNK